LGEASLAGFPRKKTSHCAGNDFFFYIYSGVIGSKSLT
jgi:hypothetical protein